MKLFDAVPSELFSVLASPNRILYSDALDVLYDAYRENLKIPESKLYTMLRSNLEQQLADASFDGEDIDEEELKDISGRARFLIRKLCAKGWFERWTSRFTVLHRKSSVKLLIRHTRLVATSLMKLCFP